ncbi:hypothetical protein [Sphingobacterium detergens]|uniref:Uncharacterized protein n=1 Tax=Sphingobacterium detergens TaxID=1145106 RepID=A0A420B7I9_SPHD1|nr:hypothetical protein [Sphingobacterium detergens]RKE52756.1 hypothetical protein DFQ12_3002 [Sphingobacterium detergens]
MPTTFAQFKEEVLALYEAKKIRHELDDLMVNPSPANLRDYCLVRLSEGLPQTDIDILQKFFDPQKKEKSLEDAISKYNTGSLKALQKFILSITQNPGNRVVKLLAILVDYKPRPFQISYNPPQTDRPDNPPPTDEKDNPPSTDEKDNPPPTDEKDNPPSTDGPDDPPPTDGPDNPPPTDEKDNPPSTDGPDDPPPTDEKDKVSQLRYFYKKNKIAIRFSAATSLIVVIFIIIGIITPSDCMCWNGERYIQIDCQNKTQRYQVIGLDKEKLEHFRKITRLDTLGLKDLGNIWYSKIDNEIEFFTAPGFHPVQPRRSLKATTKYIFETYAGKKIENNQNKQYGIMQKQ